MTQNSIQLENVNFQFPGTQLSVFTNLNLIVNDVSKVENNLYGIIGPSGVGKTTLISIIGGQLKPDSGEVRVNGQNIYQIYDIERRNLIAYQMQTASNLRGSVRVNLVFGIIETENYSDDFLIDLLKKVGLWSIFEIKDGLSTIIGEGGLNLSGGQRQRLNFAALYLRACHYNPKVILIDEPTSSLDEISEQAITKLILELSKNSIVLVVAHRLVTIKSAMGIFDLTLLSKDQPELKAYKADDLLLTSKYYSDLINNKTSLDE